MPATKSPIRRARCFSPRPAAATRQLEASGLAKVSDALRDLGVNYFDLTAEDLRRELGEPKPPKHKTRNRRKGR